MKEIYINDNKAWIGNNARDNTMMIQKVRQLDKSAIWFHLESVPSAHIIVFINMENLNHQILSQIKQLILQKTKKAPTSQHMIYTQVINVHTSEIPGEAFPRRYKRF